MRNTCQVQADHVRVRVLGRADAAERCANSQVSDGYDGRQIAAKYTNSSTTLTNNTEVTLTYSTKVFDSTANYSSGTYTVSSQGKYKVNAKLTTDSFSAAFVNSSWAIVASNVTFIKPPMY